MPKPKVIQNSTIPSPYLKTSITMNINILHTPTISPHFLSPPLFHQIPTFLNPKSKPSINTKPISKTTPKSSLSDPFVLQIAETLEDSLSTTTSTPPPLQKLRSLSTQSLLSLSWPTKKDEPFRFTDVSYLKSSDIQPVPDPTQQRIDLSSFLVDTNLLNLVFIDGYLLDSLSNVSGLPNGVVVGLLSKVSDGVVLNRVSEFLSGFDGDLFWSLNGVGTPDIVVVYVPEGCKVECPLYLRYFSKMGGEFGSNVLPVSNPRVLVVVEKGGELGLVEEFVGGDGDDKCYWSNSVLEVVVGESGCVTHSYVQNQSLGAAHIKWTCVRQEAASTYKLVELSSGGKLSRHNLNVQQVGPETVTDLSTLHLSINDQTQDLHSRLILDHPRGYSRQLHKCIVAHSRGQAVFDGNVKVNRHAQQTDAGQLTRSLLLVPQATVNVKPNLQIIADDVKCSHGAAISDLEEDQLFYFLARGIDLEMARKALIFSFGAEVLERIPDTSMRDKAKSRIAELLEPSLVASRS